MYAASLLLLQIVFSGLPFSIPVYRFSNKKFAYQHAKMDVFVLLCLSLLSGLLLNAIFILICRSLFWSFALDIMFALAGIAFLFTYGDELKTERLPRKLHESRLGSKAMIGLLCLLFFSFLVYGALFQPLSAWDARSIWFFHGKIIYHAGGIFPDAGWSSSFSHPEYPKLIAILSAQIATIAGYWNEYLPLTAIYILLGIECILLAYVSESLTFVIVLLVLLYKIVGISLYFTNGYADIHLAFMAMLTVGLFMKSSSENKRIDAILGILCLGIMAFVKNEGVVLAIVIVRVVIALYRMEGRLRSPLPGQANVANNNADSFTLLPLRFDMNLAMLMAVLPIVLWKFMAWRWGLKNDLVDASMLERIAGRLNMSTVLVIAHFINVGALFLFSTVAGVVLLFFYGRRGLIFFTPAVVCFVYFLIVLLIYLSTPYDLVWHLATSAERVSYPIKFILSFGLASCLDQIFQDISRRVSVFQLKK